MKLRFPLHFGVVVLCVLSATLGLLALSGCSGGWGELKPSIALQQGRAQTVVSGQSATFTVAAEGTGPFTYQWYLNGTPIAGASANVYTTGATVSSQNGSVYTVAVTSAGGTAMSAPYILTVNTPPAITTQPASQTVTVGQSATFTAAATGTEPLSYQWYQGGAAIGGAITSTYTTPATTSLNNAVYTVVVSNVAGAATSGAATLTMAPIVPTLSFAPVASQTYGGAAFAVSAASASSGAVTYSVASGPATIAGNMVTATGAGTVVLSANQAANGNYAAASTTTSIPVTTEVPTLSFAPVAAQTYGGAGFAVSAASASSGAVTYSVASGPATIAGNIVTATGAGAIVLSANQAANGNYAAASATTSISVTTEVPTLSFAPVATQTYGGAAFAVSAASASSGAVTYSVASGPATIVGNMVTATGAGTVVLSANQAATGNYAAATATTSISVTTEVPTLSFAPVAAQTYGGAAFAVSAASASSGAVTYSVTSGPATIAGNMVTATGAGTVVLSANQAANGNFAAVSTTTSIPVTTEVPTLSFAPVAAQTYGGAAFAVSATSASSGAVTYSVVSGPATSAGNMVAATGAGAIVLSANQAANGNYAAASTTTSIPVTTEVPTLSFAPVASQTYGGAAFAVSATSTSGGAVTYSVASGPATIAGNIVTATGAGAIVLSANQAANGNYAAASATTSISVTTEVPTLSFAPVATQTYGGAAFAVSAASASSGAVTYSVVSGPATIAGNMVTATGAGAIVLSANQAATGNYAAATATTSISVTTEVPTLSFAPVATQTYGGAAFALSAASASSGAVTYSVVSGPATIAGNLVTATGAGAIVLSANQAANGNYAAATTTTSITVNDSTPVASSLAGSASTPSYGTSITLVPTFSGGTAVIGSVGAGSSNISAAAVSGSSYATPAVTSATTYTLTVTGSGGNSVSTTFTTTPTGVTITPVTPATQTIAPGQQNFSATASGGATDNLTWSASEGSITSGGSWTSPDVPGTYTITATSADEPSVSALTTVTVSKPVITTQPMSKNACTGYNPSLTTTASYATSYQWYFNGNSLAAYSPTLTLSNVTTANNGTYSCAAINGAGLVSTNTVTLNVVAATTLAITKQPSSQSVYATQTATFSVAASGTGTLAYQWYTGAVGSGTPISGATSSTYTTAALTAANSGTSYYATVSDPDCAGTTLSSTAAILTVSAADTTVPPTIVVQPVGETATVSGNATFSVTASGSGTLTYQWYRVAYSSTELSAPTAGAAISGATSSTYTVPSSDTAQSNDGDSYYVVVLNNYGSAVSSRVVLAVGPGIVLQINANPHTDYIAASTLASFTVGATCTGCTPAYQWYWYTPGSTTATALTDGAVSSGALSGATVAGTTTSSLTLQTVPTTASGAIFYVVVTSTSDGSSQIAGTNPLTSSTAGLFVGSLGTIGDTSAGDGLCNGNGTSWVLNGNNPGQSSSNQPYQNTTGCTIELTDGGGSEHAAVYWPTLISTANFSVSFTVALSASSGPGDGFTMVLADPSQGATTASLGATGEGLGADGIPGFVLGFDTYQNGDLQTSPGCSYQGIPCDPVPVPYMAVGQGATSLWENPWTFVNGDLDTQNSTDYSPSTFANATHSYVVTVVNSVMTVTMDGHELFTGTVSLPAAAYLGFTASTGGAVESVTFSGLTATVSAP